MRAFILKNGFLYLYKFKERNLDIVTSDKSVSQCYFNNGIGISLHDNAVLDNKLIDMATIASCVYKGAHITGLHIDTDLNVYNFVRLSERKKQLYYKVPIGNLNQDIYITAGNGVYANIAIYENIKRDNCMLPDDVINCIIETSKNVRSTGDRIEVMYIDYDTLCKHLIEIKNGDLTRDKIDNFANDWHVVTNTISNIDAPIRLSLDKLAIFNYQNFIF